MKNIPHQGRLSFQYGILRNQYIEIRKKKILCQSNERVTRLSILAADMINGFM